MALTNFFGNALPLSATPINKFTWLDPLIDLVGTSIADRFMGGGGNLMYGKGGDDTYYVKAFGDVIVERAGEGIDTAVVSYLKEYALPSFVENLTIGGRADAIGNSLDNVIIGLGNSQVLNGLGGDDILAGGTEADVFAFTANSGRDSIVDFSRAEGDQIRLDDTSLLTWSAVRAAMTQDGADVILRFDADDAVRIQNVTVDSFTANDFQYRIDTSALTLTFAEEFDAYPSFYNPATGTGVWDPYFNHGTPTGPKSKLAHTNNDEQQIYVDPTYAGSGSTPLGINPFSVADGVMTITAQRAAAADQASLWNYKYTSGLLTTADTFYQQYGYFEIKAAMPEGQGVWPAFWLLPEDQTYGLELDVTEQVNGMDTAFATAHYWQDAVRQKLSYGNHVWDASAFHSYGMLWTAQEIAWYIDGVEVISIPTPPDLNKPMYVLVNLALGGQWAGGVSPDFTSAQMKIDYIHAYAVDAGATAATVNAGGGTITGQLVGDDADNAIIGSSIGDVIKGLGGNDIIEGRAGDDLIDGGAGIDTASYAASVTGVTVSLAIIGGQVTGDGTDTLLSIENLTGSSAADTLSGDNGDNILTGGAGDDVLSGGGGADLLDGGGGNDTASYAGASAKVTVDLSLSTAQNTGGAGADTLVGIENLIGTNYGDSLRGDFGANRIEGGKGADRLDGAGGKDVLMGGGGADTLTGGLAADIFLFKDKTESKGATFDTITDFSRTDGDLIDLTRIDANTKAIGMQAFTFIGDAAFTRHAGELRFEAVTGGVHIYGDVNGDGASDFHIFANGLTTMGAADFIL